MAGRGAMILGRAAQAIPVVLGVVVISLLLTRALPGDLAACFAGPVADSESLAQVREALGLAKPLIQKFFST